MRKHLNQYIFSPLSWFLVVLLVLLLVLVLLFLTPLGPRTAAQIANYSVKSLSLEGVSGSLLSGIHIDRFSWGEGTGIVLDNLDVKLKKYDFENGKIYADHVQADRLSINVGKSEEDTQDDKVVVIPDFGLPLNIDSKVVTLKSLRITKKLDPEESKSKEKSKNKKGEEEYLTTLFEIGDLQVEKLLIKDHKLHFSRLRGNPMILDAPLKIDVTDGNLNMDQPHDLHTSGRISFKHKDLGQAEGDVNLMGTLTHYEFSSDLDIRQIQIGSQKLKVMGKGDYKQVSFDSIKLSGDDGTLTGKSQVLWSPEIKWSFEGDGETLKTARWIPEWPAIVDTKIKVSGGYLADDKGKKQLENKVEILSLKGKVKGHILNAKGSVLAKGNEISSKGLDLQLGDNKVSVSGVASEPLDLNVRIDAGNLKQLVSGLTDLELRGKIKGSGSIKGSFKKPQIKTNLRADNLVYQEYKQGQEPLFLEGELALEDKLLILKNVIAKSGKNRVLVNGKASEPMNIKWEIDARQLAQISPDLGGNIQAQGELQGGYKSPLIRANIKASALRFKEHKFSKAQIVGKGEVQLNDGVPMIKSLVVDSGSNHVKISGRASSPFDLTWDIDGKNMKQFLPDLSGHLKAKGKLQGTIDNPIINATIDARNIKYQDLKLSSGDFVAKTNNGQYQVTGNLKKLEASGKKIKDATLKASGRIENHVVDLSVNYASKNAKIANAKIKAKGGWVNQRWQGTLQSLDYKNKNTGDWKLQKPVQITASQEKLSTSNFCLKNDKTVTCTKANWNKKSGLSAEGKLKKTPLALLKPWLPEGLELNGDVEGSFQLDQQNGRPKGAMKIKLPNSTFTFKTEDGEEQTFSYKDASLSATINDKKIVTKVNMEIVNRGHLTSAATIKLSPKDGKHTIDGSAKLDVPNINWAQDFIPHSRGLRGELTSKFTFSGLIAKPRIVGRADLKNGYLRLPEAGTELTNINLSLRADKPGQAVIKGKMLMGKGALNVNGSMDMRNFAKWKAKLAITGKNIRFLNTHEVNAYMSPDLNIDLTPQLISITGKVVIPQAEIKLKDIPEISIDESGDTIVLGEKRKGESVSAVKVQPNVLIELGDKVKINAFGLNAKLSGRINITHNRRDILAKGSLRVTDGKYQAYGQNLDINNGRIIFNGSPKLVGMDIRATRQVEDNLVGIHLGGTILKPKSKIFSDPTLPESQALSLLLTGHDLDSVSGQEGALLASAVHGLGVTGSDSLLHNIGSSLGLDDVNIVTKDDFKKSELALGKRLGPRVYVRYLVGLFDQAQKIAIDYKINKVLSLQAETSAENYGLDFIYKIERD